MFSTNIFTPQCLKSETSELGHLAITLLYILIANILIWYQLKTYIEDDFGKWGQQMTS